MGVTFLDAQSSEQGQYLLAASRVIVIESAIREKIIQDADLAMVPETIPVLAALVGTLRDDLYIHHQSLKKAIQFPLVAKCFGYSFAKGAEAAGQWNASREGKVDLSYRFEDAICGAAGARVNERYASVIKAGMQRSYNVFVEFQNHMIVSEAFGLAQGGRPLADAIACGFFWASQVGVDYGMNYLGYP